MQRGIVGTYRRLVRRAKQKRVEQIIISGILPVMGCRDRENKLPQDGN